VEFRPLQSAHVRRVGLIQQDGQFAEDGAGRGNLGDLHAVLEDLYLAAPEDKQPPVR